MKLSEDKLYYLASPYTHKDVEIEYQRFKQVTEIAGNLKKLFNITVIAPITTSHTIKEFIPDLGGTWASWVKDDTLFVKACDGILIATMPGWDISVGVTAEIEIAREHHIPVFLLDPQSLEVTRLRKPNKCRI